MRQPLSILLVTACLLGAIPAQDQPAGKTGEGKPQGKGKQEGKQEKKDKPGGAVDETDITAEALRRLFERLKAREGKPPETPVEGKEWKVEKPPEKKPPEKRPDGEKPTEKKPPEKTPPEKTPPEKKADDTTKPAPDKPKPKPQEETPEKPPQDKPPKPAPKKPEPRAGRDDPEEVARRMREQNATRRHPAAPTPPATGPDASPPRRTTPASPVAGTLNLRQRYRRARGVVKQDTTALLALDIGDRATHGVTAHLLARGFLDTSSRSDNGGLGGLDHTYDERYTGRLYDAHVDLHDAGPLRVVRLGRQTLYETPEVFMLDGVSAETAELGTQRVVAGVHAGVPAHLFESSPSGDFAGGVHLGLRPWDGGRVRFDYMHVDDRRRFADADDDLLGLAFWQQLGASADLFARYTRLEDRNRDVQVRTHVHLGESLDLRVTYDELLETQGALASEFDPFSQALLDYHPYRQVGASLQGAWDPRCTWDLGVTLRRLSRASDEGQFNRDFDRAYAALHLGDALVRGASLSLHADAYETDGNDTAAAGIDYRAPLGAGPELRLGSLYSLYKYDFVSQRERDHVRTWFAGLHSRGDGAVRWSLDYAFETGPFPDSHSAEARITWKF